MVKALDETELVKGMVIDKEIASSQMPKIIDGAKIVLLNAKMEIEKTEFDAKINIESPNQMQAFPRRRRTHAQRNGYLSYKSRRKRFVLRKRH